MNNTEDVKPGSLQRVLRARCRWCDRNDRPLDAMAVMSYKPSFGGYTGVCKKCFDNPAAEARYRERMDKPPNDPSSPTRPPKTSA